jgi:hypothetical protein
MCRKIEMNKKLDLKATVFLDLFKNYIIKIFENQNL